MPKNYQHLRKLITENLRVQLEADGIEYINIGTALNDACAKQNHVIFARRGCGKTLLLHHSNQNLDDELKVVYLNCEDFKRHSFPNVLIEILSAIFREFERNLTGWFGKKKKSKEIIRKILDDLITLQKQADVADEMVLNVHSLEKNASVGGGVTGGNGAGSVSIGATHSTQMKDAVERTFTVHQEKLQELDRWLPVLKEQMRELFKLSKNVKGIFLQLDDLYHLKRSDQAFVLDYVHRLCKDVPLYFKVATIRHASTLFLEKDGQPIGAQERHDFQPIDIDYTFNDFNRTLEQNLQILLEFGERAGMSHDDVDGLFKGEGFRRLVMAGGGVPRDVLSLFLELLSYAQEEDGLQIGKDEVRTLSRTNFERRIEELKQDSQDSEQDELLRGIYVLREFCLEKKTNVFVVQEKMLQQKDNWKSLINRLMDYRIIHNCANAITHKSQEGTFKAFAIDIGCYAHLRKLQGKMSEIDVSSIYANDEMRSVPILNSGKLDELFSRVPENVEEVLIYENEEE